MDDGEYERGEARTREKAEGRPPHRREGERERRRHEELPRRCRGQGERGVGAAVSRRHRSYGDGSSGRDGSRRHPAEHRVAGLVGDEHGQRREHCRLVEHHLGRIGEGDLRDESEERVPERERVAGVQAAVGEFIHRRQGEAPELGELAGARQVEETVAADFSCDAPEE